MSSDDIDIVAGEYVLGTLEGDERARVEAALQQDPALQAAASRWQRMLAPLIGAGPVPVPPNVWDEISAQM